MIYVTGANGWIGLNLIKNLVKKKYHNWDLHDSQINALILEGTTKDSLMSISPNINIVEGDVLSKSSLEIFFKNSKDAIIFHTAGIIHPKKIRDLYEINLTGTKNVLIEAAKNKAKRAVIISSNSPFGFNQTRDTSFNEDSKYNPYMNYGNSKMLMEKAVIKLHLDLGIDVSIVRPPWFYGTFQPERQKRFYEMIRKGKFPIVGNGNNLRSMVHTDNLSQGLILAANTKIASGKTYWIADERSYSMNEIVGTVRELFINTYNKPCSSRNIRLPNITSYLAEYIDFLIQKTGLYNQEMHVLSEMNRNIICDISLAKKDLFYSPKIDLKKGMKMAMDEIYF